ncbi:hypothetical protein C1645_817195 [Glomus cerebriforme]|uniref:F-box domain-containing protein n=1 Tax=Glomus cerebriforme TaxID=658196 RepID=A0A397TF33_9GLOM|nr:hypothetical protein C1645_817195 [Glomus cerebriforme]
MLSINVVQLQDDKKTFHSCLSVNKTWCETIIPILWKNPWKYLKRGKEKSLLNVIISHLSDEIKNNLKNQGIKYLVKKPLFNYISFCRYLNLFKVKKLINAMDKEFERIIIKNDIFNIFINEDTKFTHLYIPYQIHLIPGIKRCFSEIEFLSCNTSINNNVLVGLIEVCNSIKELELIIEQYNNNYEIIRLIKTQKKLFNISFLTKYSYDTNESFCKILENSLIKHANTIQYFKTTKQPITKILSSFINLKVLELDCEIDLKWNCLENLSLPFLQILRASFVPVKALTSLIENTNGYLIEIKIDHILHDEINNKRIIQAIYQNCPYLKYLELLIKNNNILEFENLLINCQYLIGLFFIINNNFDLDKLFKILTESSPTSLFKFKFYIDIIPKLDSVKLFFDNWKGRHPMLLQFSKVVNFEYLMEKYKAEGIIKKYDNYLHGKDFEWI